MFLDKKTITLSILCLLSAVLVAVSLPPFFNIPGLGFVALVPMLLGMKIFQRERNHRITFFFFGIPFSLFAYRWYIDIFSTLGLGIFLMIAVAMWHSRLLSLGLSLEKKFPSVLKIFVLPIVFSVLEFLQRSIPIIKKWWFIPYAKTQRGFPPALQIISIVGIIGATFFLIFSNTVIAELILIYFKYKERKKISTIFWLTFFLCLNIFVFAWGWYRVYISPQMRTIHQVGLVSDMSNILIGTSHHERGYVSDPVLSQKILNQNISSLEGIVSSGTQYIVWPENEFFNLANTGILYQLKQFTAKYNLYLVVDVYSRAHIGKNNGALYDNAVLISPQGEVNSLKKTHLTDSEIQQGFSPLFTRSSPISTSFADIGLGVCYDFHFTDVVRSFAKQGAKILLFPTDDDMNNNSLFPYFHATDAVFRSLENGVVMASANTNGASILTNPYGEIKILSLVNKKSIDFSTVEGGIKKTLYLKYGDWFAYLLFIIFMGMILYRKKKN